MEMNLDVSPITAIPLARIGARTKYSCFAS
jgi:hypothetical protein